MAALWRDLCLGAAWQTAVNAAWAGHAPPPLLKISLLSPPSPKNQESYQLKSPKFTMAEVAAIAIGIAGAASVLQSLL
jgi:hypothetical protein